MHRKNSLLKHVRQDARWFTISNGLSFLRILLAPVVVIGLMRNWWVFSFLIFVIAGITDLLDGYLARLFNEQTNLGKVLDPLADKIFLLTLFASLAFVDSPSFRIPLWFVILVLAREVLIVFGSYIIIATHECPKVDPSIWGKMTTFFEMLFISWLFICRFFGWVPAQTYYILLILLAFALFLSFVQYVKLYFVYLFDYSDAKK